MTRKPDYKQLTVKTKQLASIDVLVVDDAGAARNLSGMTVTAQARSNGFVLIENAVVDMSQSAIGIVTIDLDTDGWAVTNDAHWTLVDLRIVDGNAPTYTETFELFVERNVTDA